MKRTKEDKLRAFERLLDVQERLRKECPWDKMQTFESLRPYSIEEVYELCDALIKGDMKEVCKELGDLMEHVVFYALLGEEAEAFDIADVCDMQADKLMFRHDFINWNESGNWEVKNPEMCINEHGQVVYLSDVGDSHDGTSPTTATEVESTWEQRKQKEKDGNETVLSGVPSSLPSLIKAYRIQDKAKNVGFDWKVREDVWKKVHEELDELEAEVQNMDKEHIIAEFGDFLFSIINAARLYKINPDNALEQTNQKFIRRFEYVEQKLKEQHKSFSQSSLEEMDVLWAEAKQKGL